MKVAIISDSHGRIDRLKEALKLCKAKGVPNIVHAGDFAVNGVVKTLSQFSEINIKIALGNADVDNDIVNAVKNLKNVEIAQKLQFSLDNINFFVTHKPEDLDIYEHPEVDIFIHGHTHLPKFEKLEAQIVINPGALLREPKFLIFDTETKKLEMAVLNK